MDKRLRKFVESGFNYWDGLFKTVSRSPIGSPALQEIAREADGIAQKCVLVSQYLCYRGACGFGDHGHDDALKEAQKDLKKVRKAMGFTRP